MSEFKVEFINNIKIEKHPDADKLEVALVDDYRCVVAKGQFKTGDSGIYIPEAAVLPDALIEKLGLTGKLAGSKKNRVKAVRLRGVLSQGILCSLGILSEAEIESIKKNPNANIRDLLHIEKYKPEVPAKMSGTTWYAGFEKTVKYDIENFKKYGKYFEDGEEVVVTEKCHGTFALFGYMPHHMEHAEQGRVVVSSKGLSERGEALNFPKPAAPSNFKQKALTAFWKARQSIHTKWVDTMGPYVGELLGLHNTEKKMAEGLAAGHKLYNRRILQHRNRGTNENNLYWNAFKQFEPFRNVVYAFTPQDLGEPIFILGEIVGVQDLGYGATSQKPKFRVFDICVNGSPNDFGRYLNNEELDRACQVLELERVPVLYKGPYSKEKILELSKGKETVTGEALHIREGVVVRPTTERSCKFGRLQLKSISDDYLLRKDGTEFN